MHLTEINEDLIMTENLLEGRKQLENSSANLKVEQNNNQTENLQELLPDVKQSKEDKIRMETEAISQTATSDNQEHKITQFVLQLLGDLKGQEELHLSEVKELRKELEEKDNICNQLKLEISQVRENPTFYDLKSHEERHSREVKDLHTQLKLNDNVNRKLTNEVFTVRKNFIQMRKQLLNDLKSREECHLRYVNELREELKAKENNLKDQEERHSREVNKLREEVDVRDNTCHELELEVSQVRQNPEFILMRQQLLDDLKGQEELHLREVKELRKELEAKDNICYQLEIKISQVRENPEFLQMRQQLLDELKGQEELHLLEVNELHKELEEKDKICHQLENEMFGQENADFIHMRQQLMDNLKDQEERHLREISDLRKVQEDKDKLCLEKDQEAAQLRDRLNFSESCPICMDPWNSSEHRMVALLCGHIFGESCVRECLERNPNCPTCRAQASANDIRKLFTRS
ncbi:rho-associated protein kinase 2-like [Drosophila albomicans]|uniref:Rho-associated protein kinase 2-like n=1 Tax=Drosophila albomicans TaxID=7291 RepID=A0A9C6SYB8_DROAB|nr:rho-associated protein kinase 2-like [Drosophila albomicans]